MSRLVIATKLYAPIPRPGLVARPRLRQALGPQAATRLTLASAPAGFGKTTLLRPMLPCFREAFTALEQWTQDGTKPPGSHVVARDASTDLVNTCAL